MAWGIGNSKYFDKHEQIAIFVSCCDGGSEILNPGGIKSRQLVLSCSCSLILGISKFWILLQPWTDSRFVPCHDGGSEILNPFGIKNRLLFCSVKLWAWGSANSEYFDNHEQIAIFVPCRDGGSEILNPCGIKSRQLVLSCTCSLILGIRNSEYFYNYKQIIVFAPCHDGGSEILNPCGIKNRLPFCSVKLWARGSEILNLSKRESGMGARSLSHEIAQFDGISVLFLVDTTEHFFSPSN